MRVLHTLLATSASIASLALASQAAAQAADQAPATLASADRSATSGSDEQVKEIIVTGSSIRGAQPVGSNLISVGQKDIQSTPAQSVQQILKSVPAVVGLGSAGQGGFGSADGSGTNAPTIHGLGGSASNSTLVLIDGHRFPLSGTAHALGDPNIVPTIAIERVEVLADGASSVYGSDAVAGVINFVTRRSFDGLEANAQLGFADQYRTYNASILGGKKWDTGSFLVAYSFSHRDGLQYGDRSFTKANHIDQGGTNFATFTCQPASVQPGGTGGIYLSPYTGSAIANAAANSPCDYSGYSSLLPQEVRNNAFAKFTQEIGERLTVSVDAVYSNRQNRANNARGTVTATIYGPTSGKGSQINPYYIAVNGNTTSETVRFNADDLLGPGAYTLGGAVDFYVHATAEYKLTDNWRLTFAGVTGFDNSKTQAVGALCVSCAYLALNGTTNGNGSLTTPSIPGTTLFVTQALTAANALDVYNLIGANRTSATVISQLTDSTTTTYARQYLKDATAKIDGSLFPLPAGDVKVALGGELTSYDLRQDLTRSLSIGPSSTGSSTTNLKYDRSVRSAYIEALIPIIGPEMGIPAVRRFDVNLSGRYDHYSDFGSTKNPKVAANWEVIEGLKLRGNWAKSFVAPALTSRGVNAAGLTGESGYGNYGLAAVTVPYSIYPTAAQIPGCVATATSCTLGSGTVTGMSKAGGNGLLQPQKGQTWSLGADFTPTFLRGLRIGLTYWHNRIKGGITAPVPSLAVNAADLYSLIKIYPTGATAADIAAFANGLPQNSALPANIYFSYNYQQRNVLNLTVSGLDMNIDYSFDTGIGKWSLGAAATDELQFDQQIGTGPTFSVLNTTGFNTTFPSVKWQGRGNVGWDYAGISFDAFLNFTGSYRNYSSTSVAPILKNAAGVPIGGGDKVKSYKTVDLHLSYDIPISFMKKAQIFVDGTNIFNKMPPFYNVAIGYDTYEANPIGRIVTVGVRTTF